MNPHLKPALGNNLLLRTDSYKASHWLQYPPGAEHAFSYIESRGGRYSHSLFFGLQAYLREYLSTPITLADVAEAKAIFLPAACKASKSGKMPGNTSSGVMAAIISI